MALATPTMATSQANLSFGVAGEQFSVPAAEVLEVRRTPSLTRVPNSSATIAGLMNYYGNAIAVVRVSALLGLVPAPGASQDGRVVVVGHSPPIGLLVDQVYAIGEYLTATSLDVGAQLAEHFPGRPEEPDRSVRRGKMHVSMETAVPEVALLTFRVADQRYGLPLDALSEVMVLPEDFTERSSATGPTLGMLAYRDGVLPLVSMAALLGLSDVGGRHYVLITFCNGARIGLVTGAVDGISRLPETSIEPVPGILQRGLGEAEIEYIGRANERMLISILSPARLFARREVEQALQPSSTRISAMPEYVGRVDDIQFVVFSLGDESYAIPIEAVDEIMRMPESLTRLPGAPDFVAGLMNLRGKALPVIDQRQRFSVKTKGKRGRVIVVTVGELQLGFIVDAVSQILSVPASEVMPAPRVPGDGSEIFDRVVPTGSDMILIVNPKEMLHRAERDVLAQFDTAEGWAVSS
ncbi:chemotaxis protein CheW [Aestuariivirga sp.]|uniref:chemotaxis protein CheW n=1 Tax=Aestuariivirga sp. TaxID=2650926 RepID=UPI003BAB39E1